MAIRSQPIVLTIFGNFACWTRPECKVERLSYPVPTPGGMRGFLNAIYCKPEEFYWQVDKIEILNPIEYIGLKTNEVKRKMPRIPKKITKEMLQDFLIDIEADRTQRQTIALKNVKYRVTAHLVLQPTATVNISRVYEQAIRRIGRGQAFFQPSLGLREFEGYFELGSDGKQPISDSSDIGLMLYDTFEPYRIQGDPSVSLFRAEMVDGVVSIPPYESPQVLKSENACSGESEVDYNAQ